MTANAPDSDRDSSIDLQTLAEDEADLKLGNADGDGRRERLQNAYDESMGDLRSTQKQRQQTAQNIEQERRRLRDLGRTIQKCREVGDDPDIFVSRDYPGGFQFELPPGDREAAIRDLHDEIGNIRQRLQSLAGTREKLDRQHRVVKATLRELEGRATTTPDADAENAPVTGGEEP